MEQEKEPLSVVFLGTPEFAATILRKLYAWEGGKITGVFTQPDRPCGRGQACTPPPTKTTAEKLGLPVFQPEHFRSEENIRLLETCRPDLLVVAAYGLILPQRVLDLAPFGAINVHASLLPKYRGAAPIQRCIVNGEAVTGVTIMQMVARMDAGPILKQRALGIALDDTAQIIHDELAELGATLLLETLDDLRNRTLVPMDQEEERATYAPKLTKEEGLIDWNRPALSVHNQIRGLYPWPGAYFLWQGPGKNPVRLTVFPGTLGERLENGPSPGTILGREGDHIAIACRDRVYLVQQLQPAGKKPLNAKDFECGYLSRCEE